ncbi:MAG TPA: hypothetical protein DCE44_23525 [Verrucomicrobiales bacterium]|nr:hypothetical protein [Verrucomicrobiales bacterium]
MGTASELEATRVCPAARNAFNGIVRFDGVEFPVFDPGNPLEPPSRRVVNVPLERLGRLARFRKSAPVLDRRK